MQVTFVAPGGSHAPKPRAQGEQKSQERADEEQKIPDEPNKEALDASLPFAADEVDAEVEAEVDGAVATVKISRVQDSKNTEEPQEAVQAKTPYNKKVVEGEMAGLEEAGLIMV